MELLRHHDVGRYIWKISLYDAWLHWYSPSLFCKKKRVEREREKMHEGSLQNTVTFCNKHRRYKGQKQYLLSLQRRIPWNHTHLSYVFEVDCSYLNRMLLSGWLTGSSRPSGYIIVYQRAGYKKTAYNKDANMLKTNFYLSGIKAIPYNLKIILR